MAKTATKPQEDTGLPLFFQRPVPLELPRHAKAGLVPLPDFSFASSTNSVLINAVEFFEASKHYPIVFTMAEDPFPTVVMGLEQQNYFVNKKGEWKADSYIPGYVRKYPFIFMNVPDRKEFLLCIDEAASHYKESGGKDANPLYKDDKPSELTANALEFCSAYQSHYEVTRNFCNDIKEAGLLMPMRSDVKLANERAIQLAGFQSIDEKKLSELPDAKILEFFRKGWLPLLYAVLSSSSNWRRLVDLAAEQDKAAAD